MHTIVLQLLKVKLHGCKSIPLKNLEKNKKTVDIEIGRVVYLDYSKTYSNELSYYHYGLCVGKKARKLFIIPITSAKDWIETCYHPTNNPLANKKNRQALLSEGFSRDCVLLMNDAKFISAGRIEELDALISGDVLEDIKRQLFSVCFPNLFSSYNEIIDTNEILVNDIEEKNEVINKLKEENSRLNDYIQELLNKNIDKAV